MTPAPRGRSNAQIGIAYAAFYPSLTLGAERGFESSKFSRVSNASSSLWSLGLSISETVFDAELRRATVHQYIATYNADLAAYRQNVLTVFQQVEDYLSGVQILSKQLIQQRQAEQSAERKREYPARKNFQIVGGHAQISV